MTIWGTPGWANGGRGPNVAPQRAEDFQRFVEAAAQRYRYVTQWIMWNEPNKATWLKPTSPKTYVTQILNPGYSGVKAVNRRAQRRRRRHGPARRPGRHLTGRLHRGHGSRRRAARRVCAPPVSRSSPATRRSSAAASAPCSRWRRSSGSLRIVGDAFPRARIWLTEYAYQTNPPDRFGVSLELQAQYVGEAARRVYSAPKVDMLIHYLYRDEPDIARLQSGLEMINGKPKPALDATMFPLAQIARRGDRTTVWGQVRPGEGRQRYVLQQLVDGRWVNIGRAASTDRRGYFRRTVRAAKGSQLRMLYPARRLTSVQLSVSARHSARGPAGSASGRPRSLSPVARGAERPRDQLGGAVDVLIRDAEVRHGPDDGRVDRRREADALVAKARERVRAREAERRDVDLDEVRLDLLESDGDVRASCETLGEQAGTRVVVGEPVDVVLERVDARRGDDPGLAHRAAEEVLLAPGALDQLARAREQRAERAAQALRETERDGVEAGGDLGGVDAERDGGVEQARAVEVDREAELARGRDDVLELVERPDAPARVVVRVLEREHGARWSATFALGSARCADLLRA